MVKHQGVNELCSIVCTNQRGFQPNLYEESEIDKTAMKMFMKRGNNLWNAYPLHGVVAIQTNKTRRMCSLMYWINEKNAEHKHI